MSLNIIIAQMKPVWYDTLHFRSNIYIYAFYGIGLLFHSTYLNSICIPIAGFTKKIVQAPPTPLHPLTLSMEDYSKRMIFVIGTFP